MVVSIWIHVFTLGCAFATMHIAMHICETTSQGGFDVHRSSFNFTSGSQGQFCQDCIAVTDGCGSCNAHYAHCFAFYANIEGRHCQTKSYQWLEWVGAQKRPGQ